jgi:hypothetical protein
MSDKQLTALFQGVCTIIAIGIFAIVAQVTDTHYTTLYNFKILDSFTIPGEEFPIGVVGLVDGKKVYAVAKQAPFNLPNPDNVIGQCYAKSVYSKGDSKVYYIYKSVNNYRTNCDQ